MNLQRRSQIWDTPEAEQRLALTGRSIRQEHPGLEEKIGYADGDERMNVKVRAKRQAGSKEMDWTLRMLGLDAKDGNMRASAEWLLVVDLPNEPLPLELQASCPAFGSSSSIGLHGACAIVVVEASFVYARTRTRCSRLV